MKLRVVLWSLAAVFAAVVMAAGANAQDASPVRGGAIVASWGGQEPSALFVPAGGPASSAMTATKVLERLVKMESDLSFSSVLALSVKPSGDFKQYTIEVRPGVKWHDGRDFTAEDVAFSAMDYWKPIAVGVAFRGLKSAEVVGPHTVIMTFDTPMPEFAFKSHLADWALVIPKHIYGKGDIATNPANNKLVGTGPFKLKTWVRGSHVEYERNTEYWNKKLPYLDRLIIRYWRDPASRSAALEAGELDIATFNPVPATDIPRLTSTGNIVATKDGYKNSAWILSMEFNSRRDIMAKPEVRRALLHAIDRRFIASTIYYNLAKPGVAPTVSSNSIFFTDAVQAFDYDKAKAASMLDAAGYPVKSGVRFGVNLVVPAWFADNVKVGQYLKQALEDVNLGVNLVVADRPTALKRIYSDYDFDIALSNIPQTIEPIPVVTRSYTTDSILKGVPFRNANGYSNPVVDKLVESMAVETNPEKRKAIAVEFSQIVTKDAPYLVLMEIESVTLARSGVKNHSNSANFMNESWGDLWIKRN
ncbi:MAG: ABC transporter substrate-binding protein [Hyphomonadaceae bacterium]|jgi:peptide/nickel transport system substrate-binding protein|nr:ABC transporter substrate-binding protein [Hyphomonadaceae bacterium]